MKLPWHKELDPERYVYRERLWYWWHHHICGPTQFKRDKHGGLHFRGDAVKGTWLHRLQLRVCGPLDDWAHRYREAYCPKADKCGLCTCADARHMATPIRMEAP